ncbi:helix-turn-helix domain-containing protein [Kribbella solani]|uniref:AcrR family transcriptional regulator n=1 Tax=Kribbella solani TaxID=236067 RepID=A0A841DWN6_9ACTN|nr:helix-turn-helix domain-containing protein [Kribbella solani]MBB5982993.1 AcrR family transcriptional regulator [Kribbella solani]MDX2968366.1 helix-turn-helix domain containing protein [Kribbella solani]MDX3000727.1 helix-turn-helix domain containing protein [Kribbella solani]
MRADARDNRARIMTAADDVFGRSPSASTDDVARLAGVGIATVFRHFPTKTELLEAVLTLRLERLRERARELSGDAEPGKAFFEFFTQVVSESASKLAIAEALTAAGAVAGAEAQEAGRGMRSAFNDLLTAAQRAGAVRTDAEFPEVYALLIGASRGATAAKLDPAVRDRMLTLIYAGLKPYA